MVRKTVSIIVVALVAGLPVWCGSAFAQTQTNLIKNPSFEATDDKGLPADWSLRGIALEGKSGKPRLVIGAPARDGKNAAQLSFGPALDSAYVDQCYWKVLAPGERYSFSVWLRAQKRARASIVIAARGEKIPEIQRRDWIDVTPEWERYSTAVTIEGAGQYVLFRCIVQLHTPGVRLSIDDAALVHENPQPAGERSLHLTHSVGCVRTKTAPVIDGKLDEPCWEHAGIAEDFTNVASSMEPKPTQQTKVYLLHDEKNLYVAYRCYESNLGSVKAEKAERDASGLWGDDCVELYLLPPDSSFPGIPIVGQKYYYLVVNSLGTQGDNVGLYERDQWDGKWLARTARERGAWTVEMQIPFAEVDSRPSEGGSWKVNFTRSEKRLGENSSWSPVDVRFHDPTRFADMYFVKDQGAAALVMAAAVARQSEKITGKWRHALSSTADEIERLLEPLRASSCQEAKDLLPRLTRAQKEIKDLLRDLGAMKPQEVLNREETLDDRNETALANANVLANAANALPYAEHDRPFIIRSAPTITNDRILPTSLVSGTAPRELALSACPGEYEPVSFVVTPSRDVEGLTVTCSDLTSSNGVIGAADIDIKLVKCWYQGGDGWTPGGGQTIKGKVLLPELLVNDDDLVRVDLEKKQNLLRVTDPKTNQERYEDATGNNNRLTRELLIRDADTLQPVNIPGAGQVRQFWVTVHVPEDASAGTYEGRLTVRCEGSSDAVLPLRLEVHPFKLAPSVVEQSIYYEGKLSGSTIPIIDQKGSKTEAQYKAELRDLVAHGVIAPLCYQCTEDGRPAGMGLMKRVFELRKEAGVSTDRFFGCFWGYGPKSNPDLARRVLGEVIELTKSFGYREYYNYGPDEAGVEQAREQIAPWKFLREEIGAKVYLAAGPALWEGTGPASRELWNQVKEVVNLIVAGGTPNPEWAKTLHEAGLLIYSYANPQCGVEEPLTYRRNYGLLLWKAGYDGAMDYAYQKGFGGHMWNDFDRAGDKRGFRDHVMAYPTSDGVVDTLQWEGYREGVDDLRYLSTLLEKIEEAKKDPALEGRAREIEKWVTAIDPSGDLDELRKEIVVRIVELLPEKK